MYKNREGRAGLYLQTLPKYFGVIRIAGSKMRQDALNVFDIKREAAAAREKSPPRGRLLPPILPWEISTCLKTS